MKATVMLISLESVLKNTLFQPHAARFSRPIGLQHPILKHEKKGAIYMTFFSTVNKPGTHVHCHDPGTKREMLYERQQQSIATGKKDSTFKKRG